MIDLLLLQVVMKLHRRWLFNLSILSSRLFVGTTPLHSPFLEIMDNCCSGSSQDESVHQNEDDLMLYLDVSNDELPSNGEM